MARALSDHDVAFVFSTGDGRAGVDKSFQTHWVLTKPYTRPQLIDALTALLGPAMMARSGSGGFGAD